ncbi:uncharacterized protein LOC132598423 [Lycium barbarum]|uniref:uncharacterized protein LOC132598423 n=1 Tax=Lycium barbarum TaxID=112863 RepID=UPI00293EF6AF|nr:uncharacterized protein LOC132598423 [Lycium barbarum]
MKPLEKNHSSTTTPEPEPEPVSTMESGMFSDDIDSSCSTPYVSAPSSPGRNQPHSGFYYSAPASPMHFVLTTVSVKNAANSTSSPSEDFDFSARLTGDGNGGAGDGSMSSADELFLNGQIRPMKLSTHLKRPQVLAPLLDLDENEEEDEKLGFRGRDNLKLRDRSLRRRTRSMSPLRTTSYEWQEEYEEEEEEELQVAVKEKNEEIIIKQDDEVENEASNETTPCPSGSSSRSSSVGRGSKRWVFLKEFLYRSKSEGRNNTHKFWSGISFSPVKEKKLEKIATPKGKQNGNNNNNTKEGKKKFVNGSGIGKRRVPPSPHELHYTTNRAQSEEMRRKTFLPYRQGLLGCLGFSSKSYGAMNGFARALNPVSSR